MNDNIQRKCWGPPHPAHRTATKAAIAKQECCDEQVTQRRSVLVIYLSLRFKARRKEGKRLPAVVKSPFKTALPSLQAVVTYRKVYGEK